MKKFLLLFTFLFSFLSYSFDDLTVALSDELYEAVVSDDIKQVSRVFDEKELNPNSPLNRKALRHAAVIKKDIKMLEVLLKYGVNPNLQNDTGETILWETYHAYRLEFLRFASLYPKIIDLLLQYNADPKIANHNNWTVLHRASLNKDLYWMKRFLEKEVDPNTQDRRGETPLHLVIQSGSIPALILLLSYNANPNITNNKGETPLLKLHETHNLDSLVGMYPRGIEILLEHNTDLKKETSDGWTVLHRAANNNELRMAKRFVNHGANPNLQNKYGETPLHVAAKKGNLKLLKFLLENGADPHIKNNKGKTPLDLVSSWFLKKRLEMKQILKKAMCKSAVTK